MSAGDGTLRWSELRDDADRRLRAAGISPSAPEARWLVERAAGERYDDVAVSPATERGVAHLNRMITRRLAGEPIQYVLGRWAFRTLDLFVDRRVLIPRPETEVVAGRAIDVLAARPGPQVAVDLGTGSGAIALSLAAELAGRVEVWAVDSSPGAIAVARANAAGLGMRGSAVRVVEGDWFGALPPELRGRVDVVVSNPPYVADADPLPAAVVDWEPADALRAGSDGLDDLRAIVRAAPEWLTADGVVVVELDPRQVEAVRGVAVDAGFRHIDVVVDLTTRPRALVLHR